MSLRDKILAADDIQTEAVEIPEWGVTVEVRGMNGADRSRILEKAADSADGRVDIQTMYVETVIASTYDPESGEPVFTPDDRSALLGKSAAALDRLAAVGMRLSGMDERATETAKKRFPDEPAS